LNEPFPINHDPPCNEMRYRIFERGNPNVLNCDAAPCLAVAEAVTALPILTIEDVNVVFSGGITAEAQYALKKCQELMDNIEVCDVRRHFAQCDPENGCQCSECVCLYNGDDVCPYCWFRDHKPWINRCDWNAAAEISTFDRVTIQLICDLERDFIRVLDATC